MTHLYCIVQGRVQGVGFRYFVATEALSMGLKGWVRNLPTGEVELEAEGDRSALEPLLQRIKQGPPLSRVDEVQIKWSEGPATNPAPGGAHSF